MVMSSCALSHPFAGLTRIDSFVFMPPSSLHDLTSSTESKENPSHNTMRTAKLSSAEPSWIVSWPNQIFFLEEFGYFQCK